MLCGTDRLLVSRVVAEQIDHRTMYGDFVSQIDIEQNNVQ